jgi:hypothetical protein
MLGKEELKEFIVTYVFWMILVILGGAAVYAYIS